MGLQVYRFYVCLFLLIAITSSRQRTCQDIVFPEDSKLFQATKGIVKDVREKINETGKRVNSIFQPFWIQSTTTTTTTEGPNTENIDAFYRMLIDLPRRCPANQTFIKGHCRSLVF
ncbi:hypothetical protein WH47_09890 [Habropoda laboriosa]|uniref:Uncharacterized protein n=1 Tax=Habropoda laboriosa TaxID=597456 RepID=A0A0L7R3F1_9HYME|nr:PREDICTED: uncharacterized protein LOC108572224 [Habropoda laboriosa]KOC65311.1 hypothetical protein WH47_09890 [Habropoda laboriosa]